MEANTAALDRLTESVRQVGIGVTAVAGAIRAHPAAQDDSGKLNALADQLDQAATSLSGLAASVDAPAAGEPAPTTVEPVAEPVAETTTETTTDPVATTDIPVGATNDPSQPELTPTPDTIGDAQPDQPASGDSGGAGI